MIRPYADADVQPVLERLLNSREVMKVVAALRFPRLYRWLRVPLRMVSSRGLHRHLDGVDCLRDFQAAQEPFFRYVVDRTTAGFTYHGTDHLDPAVAYTFISNHRDIALDSALVNYALWLSGRDTVRSGIGDNLLGYWYATDLMRLNKSFVIPRSGRSKKAMYRAFREVSEFIHESIASGESIWLAQRPGRAKDGRDRMDPAVLKMLQLGYRSKQTRDEALTSLNIVPVAVSYELDPCDQRKAVELEQVARTGTYDKAPGEDMESIVIGIRGSKGRVHVEFGEPLTASMRDVESVASAVDGHIARECRLFPTQLWAWQTRAGRQLPAELGTFNPGDPSVRELQHRLQAAGEALRPWLIDMYANPVDLRLELGQPTAPE